MSESREYYSRSEQYGDVYISEEVLEHRKMPARGYGQKFGHALQKAEQYRFEYFHLLNYLFSDFSAEYKAPGE